MNKEVKIQLYKENNLGLDGYLTLTKESDLPFSISVGDIKDISKRTSTFSKSITIAGTKENNKLLSYYYDVNIIDQTFNINKLQKARVIIDGEILYDNCLLQLIEINKRQLSSAEEEYIEYTVQIKTEQSNFFDIIKNKELTDIEFTVRDISINNTPSATYSPTFVLNSFDNTYIDGYKMIYQNSVNDEIGLNMFKPSTYLWTYWNRIISDAGFRYTFDEIGVTNSQLVDPSKDELRMRKLLIPYTGPIDKNTLKEQLFYRTDVSSNPSLAPYKVTATDGDIDLSIVNNDDSLSYTTTGSVYKYTSKFSGFIKYNTTSTYDIMLDNTSGAILQGKQYANVTIKITVKNVLYKNGVMVDSAFAGDFQYLDGVILPPGINTMATGLVNSTSLECVVAPGDYTEIKTLYYVDSSIGQVLPYIIDFTKTYEEYLNVTNQTVQISSVVSNGSLNFGSILDFNDFIPNKIKQSDFIKSIFNMFNIYVEMDKNDANLLHFYTRDEYYDNGETKNWNGKIAKDKEQIIKLVSDDIKKNKLFTYKQDKDLNNISYFDDTTKIYGETNFIADNEYLTGEDKVELIFSPSPVLMDKDKYYTNLSTDSLRILYDGGSQNCQNYNIRGWSASTNLIVDKYSMVTHFDNPNNPTYDLNYNVCEKYFYTFGNLTTNNLFNKYWRRTMYQLNNSKLYTVYLNLLESDIHTLKLNDIIYLNESYWYINKIMDYNPVKTNITKVELISVDELQKYANTKITGVIDVGIGTPIIAPIRPEAVGTVIGGGISIPDDTRGITYGFDNIIGAGTTTVGNNNTNTGVGGTIIGTDNINTSGGMIIGDRVVNRGSGNIILGSDRIVEKSNVLIIDQTEYGDEGITRGTASILIDDAGEVKIESTTEVKIEAPSIKTQKIEVVDIVTTGTIETVGSIETTGETTTDTLVVESDTTFNGIINVMTPFKATGIDITNTLVSYDIPLLKGTGLNSILNPSSSNTASGKYSISLGESNNSIGDASVTIGTGNNSYAQSTVAIGTNNTVGDERSAAIGDSNFVDVDRSIAVGFENEIYGNNSFAIGSNNEVNGRNSVAIGTGLTANENNTTYVDNLNINTLNGGGASVNNLGIDSNGKVVIGSGGASSNIVYDTYTNIKNMKTNSTLIPGKFYYITDRDIMLTAVKNNEFALAGSRVFNIIKDSFYTPSVAGTLNYGGIYGQTIAKGSYPNSSFIANYYVIWGGRMWRRQNAGVEIPGTSNETIQAGWTAVARTDTTFYETKVFDIKYDIDTDRITEQSDDRGNVIKYSIWNITNSIDITDWGNVNIYNNENYGVYNNFRNSTTKATIYKNSNNGWISNNSNDGEIDRNLNNGTIEYNSNTGHIYGNLNNGNITNNTNIGEIRYNSNNSEITNNSNNGHIYGNSNNGNINNNTNNGYIYYNSNSGSIRGNSNSSLIEQNSNNGEIFNNSNNGQIFNNSNNGYINNNSNRGGIYKNSNNGEINLNSSLSTGTFVIDSNANNGFIYYNRSNTTSNIIISKCMNNGNIGNFSTAINRTTSITQPQIDL